ncbi:MAG: Uma2 family endonuclease [Roseburia sp.]|nr:Uma2 family endonuclease [Roseburia sp.]
MEALSREELYNIDDIYSLPEGERAELIDGQIYYMAPPNTKHQRLSGRIYNVISNYIQSNNGSCEPFAAPFAVFLNGNDKTYVEPDISVICDKSKLTDKGCNGAPDWVIEIVSPSSRQMDYYKKLFQYRTAGVREYWVVDPDKQTITVYDFAHDTMEEYGFSDKVRVGIYEDLEIDFAQINAE